MYVNNYVIHIEQPITGVADEESTVVCNLYLVMFRWLLYTRKLWGEKFHIPKTLCENFCGYIPKTSCIFSLFFCSHDKTMKSMKVFWFFSLEPFYVYSIIYYITNLLGRSWSVSYKAWGKANQKEGALHCVSFVALFWKEMLPVWNT